ncbi:tetratricopeptide repeat protein [Streptomyces sp. NPDC057616]|uniref:tetratricopeptide repeat protein n=1 Tax=Streptomyces sp. NPDC057616 TaxID=3346183 RepID=UPI0036A889C9
MDSLEAKFANGESRVQVIGGLGGCGKTTIALHLARQARDRGYEVFWLSASSSDRLVTGMREVARELGADEDELEAAWNGRISATDLVWRHLDTAEQPWLMIIDNADEPAWLAAQGGTPGDGTGWLRSSHAGMCLVTSRISNPNYWGHEADTHRIGVLSPSDGKDVLLDLAGEAGDPADALILSERLDGLPLALKIAGSYLARSVRGAGLLRRHGRHFGRVRGFAEYTQALEHAGTDFLDQNGRWESSDSDTESSHRRLIGRTWEISLDLLDEQELPEARALMRVLSCCASAPLPVDLLDPETLWGSAFRDELELERADRALEALIDLSLIDVVEVNPTGNSSACDPIPCLVSHRLVLEANALRLSSSDEREREEVWKSIARAMEKGSEPAPEQPRNWPWWRLFSPHVAASLSGAPDSPEIVRPLLRVGLSSYAYHAFSNGFDDAEKMAKLLIRRSDFLSEGDPLRLSIRHRAMLSLLDGEDQVVEGERILSAQLETLGEEHPETLITRHDLTMMQSRHGRISESAEEAELRSILDARRRVLGHDSPYTILTHSVLASLMRERGQEVEGEYRALIEHVHSLSPEDHKFLPLHDRHQMAHALDALNRLAEAEAEYQSVLEDLEGHGGEATRLYRDMANCLAKNLARQRKYADALRVMEKLLGWFDESDDEHSSATKWGLYVRHRRADMMRRCGRPAEAATEIRSVLSERLGSADASDSIVLQERHCLAHALDDQGEFSEARSELQDVVLAYSDILGPNDSQTREARFCLARMFVRQGLFVEALQHFEQVLAAESAELGEDHTDYWRTLFRVKQCQRHLGIIDEPETLRAFEEIAAKQMALLDDSHDRVSAVRKAISELRASTG